MDKRTERSSVLLLIAGLLTLASGTSIADESRGLLERLRDRRANEEPVRSASDDLRRPGNHTLMLKHDGLTRKYLIHVPRNYDARKPAPLVVALHGGGGSMEYQADDSKYGLITKSEETGTVVVFPNGYSRRDSGRLATWSAGECCGPARDENVDDVGFIRAMLVEVRKKWNVDGDRIYATGISNGGLMAYRLACEMSDVFRAIAPVAGTDNTLKCTPSHPVSVLHIHAKNDSHVLFDGGAGPDAFKSAVNEFTSVPATISKWTKLNACTSPPRRSLEVKGAYCERHEPCKNATVVELCVTESGGHSWPGGQKRRGEAPSKAISATDVMWDFFESVSR